MNAIMYKMKADYLRYIFECINGDDGLLKNRQQFLDEENKVLTDIPESFDDDTADRLH
jgi:hypothetical protein